MGKRRYPDSFPLCAAVEYGTTGGVGGYVASVSACEVIKEPAATQGTLSAGAAGFAFAAEGPGWDGK